MATTPGSRDPRRVAYDPRLKRPASRSPSGEHKHAPKTARPSIATSASHDDGSNGRRSSITSNDPRFNGLNGGSPAHSRRNSSQPNGNTNGNTVGYNSYITGGGSGRSTPQSSTAPVANMSSASSTNAQTQTYSSIFTAFMNMSEQGAKVAKAEVALDAASAALQKASREYDAGKAQFMQFPAIKESKTGARQKAQRIYDDALKRLQQAKSAQQQIIGTAASALLGGEERVTRIEFNQLKIDTERRQSASEPRLDVESVEKRLASVEDRVASHSTASLEAELRAAKQDFTKLGQKFERIDVESVKRVADVESVEKRVASVEKRVASHSTSSLEAELRAARQDLTSLHKKVTAMEKEASAHSQHVKDLQGVQQQFPSLNDRIQALETRPTAAPNDVLAERVTKLEEVQETREERLNEVMINALENFRGWTQDEVHKALNEMTTKADSLKSWTEDKLKTTQQPATAREPDLDENGLPKFKPVLFPPNEEPELPWKSQVETRLMGLDHMMRDHEKRLNNTTTDSVVHDMTRAFHHHYHTEYPALKNWQATVNDMSNTWNSLAGRIHNLETQAVGRQEVVQLRNDLTSLSNTVGAQGDKVLAGQQAQQIQNQVLQLRNDLNSLSNQVGEHDTKVLRSMEAIKNLGEQFRALEQDLVALQGSHQAAIQRALGD